MNEQTKSLRTIFNEAAEIPDAAHRADYLQRECGADAKLRHKIEDLLSAHGDAGGFLGDGGATTVLAPAPITERAGDRIGRYKLLQQIGEGGCGVVYMAEQEEPVRRRVALKVIKLGMDTKSVIARFEAERQALALMDHPNIAKVFDGGATDAGRPFFVMELVRGVRITDYCDEAKLSTRERLDLFIKVCQAIQHAHQKGIIHRDIKPSNILVTVNDGVAVPKVIDFGIAKATEARLTDKTLFTQFEALIGTPAYMSPEQAVMTSLDIDTRSDIYSLGVLLYEMLTGKTPFDAKELMAAGIDEMRRTIREQEPARPSTRLSTMLAAELTTTAQRRQADAPQLVNLLRGDLDWIVMKALEKDRSRRYETANGFAADIQRHLSNEPVTARPPSPAYRFQKMVRRNKLALAAGTAIALTLIAALAFSTTAFVREKNARLHAAAAEQAREEARLATEAESIRADSVANFVTHFIDTVVPDLQLQGHRESIKRLLEVADRLALELTNAPLAQVRVRLGVAWGYCDGLLDDRFAAPMYRAIESQASKLGPEGQLLAERARMFGIGSAMWNEMDRKYAIKLVEFGQAALQRNPPDYYGAAFGHGAAAEFFLASDSLAEAERFAREAARLAALVPDADWMRYNALQYLVVLTDSRGDLKEAEKATDEFFGLLRKRESESRMPAYRLTHVALSRMWLDDWSHFPKASLERALASLPVDDTVSRNTLQGLLGVAIARSGDWQRGLDALRVVTLDEVSGGSLWMAGIQLAALLGNTNTQQTFAKSGLARFASNADGGLSSVLAEQLLLLQHDPSYLPVITNLVTRSQEVPNVSRDDVKLTKAMFQYRLGQLLEAKKTIDDFLGHDIRVLSRGYDPTWAKAWFLRSSVLIKLGERTAATQAYEKGLKFQGAYVIKEGRPYIGDHWPEACTAEFLRREAATLLGDVASPDAPAPSKS